MQDHCAKLEPALRASLDWTNKAHNEEQLPCGNSLLMQPHQWSFQIRNIIIAKALYECSPVHVKECASPNALN